MIFLILAAARCSIFTPKKFNLPLSIAGNWSCIYPHEKLVLYFITLGYRRFEAVLYDNLLDVNVTKDYSARIRYKNTTFDMDFANFSTNHYYGFAKINENYQIIVEFYSQYAVDVTLIDTKTRKFETYLFTKKPEKMEIKEIVIIMSVVALFYFILKKVIKRSQIPQQNIIEQ